MKTLLITAAIAALSVQTAHSETAEYNWAVRVIDFGTVATACKYLGFNVQTDTLVANMQEAAEAAIMASSAPEATGAKIHDKLMVLNTRVQRMNGMLSGDTAADGLHSMEAIMTEAYPACAAFAKDTDFKPYIQNGPFQASGRPATALDFVKFNAENGSANYMIILSGLYGEGVIGGKPDRQNAFIWMRKAGLAGDAQAAGVTAGDYAAGDGTPKDLVQAEQWHRMAIAMGGGDPDALAELEKTMTPAQIAAGKAAAHKWLAENGYE
ncbi:hypothetical protein [Asticcacaulis sp. 201]|uniref:hypothetical protein n=1 Tax=Asticcacaulis sp. 201 TaxID=3028787 RepID=UPI0029164211|nr:hypothetical protein [Asticcacaulis sp. 201]MDV6330116.1 hypothetical protein [Asticcacaulis sp. 201]